MDQRRVGRSLAILRRRRGMRQRDVADVAGVSQATISAIERGRLDAMPLRTLCAVFDALEADVDVVVRFRRGELDRLLDEDHAAIVAALAGMLRRLGWRVEVEVTFNDYGDRGSIDLLASHPARRVLLVVEVKTEIMSAEETLRRLDVKARIAPKVARERFGEAPSAVVRMLAIRESSANRSRAARLEPLFASAFPLRGRALRGWLRSPGPVGRAGGGPRGDAGPRAVSAPRGGLLFVRHIAGGDRMRGRRRVRVAASVVEAAHRA